MSMIRFEVLPPIRCPEEPVFLCGSLPELGLWDPTQAMRMEWKPPFHVADLHAETGTSFEYKILRGSWETEAVDAFGSVVPNHSHEVWLDSTRHHTVADWKDCFAGRLTRERMHSRVLAGWRDLLVWLPPGYSSSAKRYPLLVLHDGNNIFDPTTSFSGVDWAADEWVRALAGEGVMPESIVAAVCHNEGFSEENDSLRDFDLSPELGGAAYAQFIVRELVAHLDSRYRTLAEPAARVLAGASLGGLLTFYVAIHHPGLFGNFACLSTAFEDVSESLPDNAAQLRALEAEPALPEGARMFFDYGDTGLDTCYAPYHDDLAAILTRKGWTPGREFTVRRVSGAGHNELSWRSRFGEALRFLARRGQ